MLGQRNIVLKDTNDEFFLKIRILIIKIVSEWGGSEGFGGVFTTQTMITVLLIIWSCV
jgi:hypothetical protein